jgi:hypothetical protein
MLVLGIGNYAAAQTIDVVFNQKVEWSHETEPGKSLMQALDELRDPARSPEPIHFHVKVEPELQEAVKVRCLGGTIRDTLKNVIDRLAEVCGMQATFNMQTVTITRGRTQATPEPAQRLNKHEASGIDLAYPTGVGPANTQPTPQTSQPRMENPAPNTLRRAAMDYQANTASGAYHAPQADPVAVFQADMIRSGFAPLMAGSLRPPFTSFSYGGYYPNIGRVGASQPGPMGLGMWWYADCVTFPNDRNCTHGDLKIDGGGERFLQGIDIHVDHANRGPASRFNNRFNHGLALATGEHFVQFVRVKDDMVVYETTIWVESRYVNKGHPNLVKVDKDRIEHGPHRKRVNTPRNKDLPRQEVEDVLRTPQPPL